MSRIDERSLGRTLAAVEERPASPKALHSQEAIAWLLSRQATSGQRRGIFEPLSADFEETRLATGERLRTRLAVRNVLSHETVRILCRLAPRDARVRQAAERAQAAFRQDCYVQSHCAIGECAYSAISYMRLLATLDDPANAAWTEEQLGIIQEHRLETGRWRQFPFYYTLLALLELPDDIARAELKHAVPACLRARNRMDPPQSASARRSDVVARVLARNEHEAGSLWEERTGVKVYRSA